MKGFKLKAPELDFGGWLGYFGNVAKVSPFKKGMGLGSVPNGVLQLGGVYALKRGRIVLRYAERVPGDNIPVEDVLQALDA
mmetsp:Transcript_46138/g.144334  ORF Transcript_46138/g.144334 Transcript_46138/m.144334 type:complete len:81 (+) Transcript_46138:430-672(+)